MNSFFIKLKNKRYLQIMVPYIIVLIASLVLILLFSLLTKKHPVFGVAQIVVLLALSGTGMAKFLRNQLRYQDVFSYMTNSLVFGSICVPFLLFVFFDIFFQNINICFLNFRRLPNCNCL